MSCGVARAPLRAMRFWLPDSLVCCDVEKMQQSLTSRCMLCGWSRVSRDSVSHFLNVCRWNRVGRHWGTVLSISRNTCWCHVKGDTAQACVFVLSHHRKNMMQFHSKFQVSCLQCCVWPVSMSAMFVQTQRDTQCLLFVLCLFKCQPVPSPAPHMHA